MSKKAHGQLRQGQLITTYGPGALIDMPRDSAIVGGLEGWPKTTDLEEIEEPRLSAKLQALTGVVAPQLFAPPAATNDPRDTPIGIRVWRFPEWFIVQEKPNPEKRDRSRRIVHRKSLDEKRRFDGENVIATRFVRACPKGHVDDIDWHYFVHGAESDCPRTRQLWLDEQGTSGDLADLAVRCECGARRGMYEAAMIEEIPLGVCRGKRPWLGKYTDEDCNQPCRLLIRTASNAYFSQPVSVLSLPDVATTLETKVRDVWDVLNVVDSTETLQAFKRLPAVAAKLAGVADEDVLKTIEQIKAGGAADRPVKEVELEAILGAPEGFGDDAPIDPDFHARRLPDNAWRKSDLTEGVEAVVQLHRLREVIAIAGFTRLEAVTPNINGEYDTDVERASLALEPQWFPAVENRGEGVFVLLRTENVHAWLEKAGVKDRLDRLAEGHKEWAEDRKSKREFPHGPYWLLHTLSHLLMQSLAMRCGYPASSIRERIYADTDNGHYGLLLYTGSPDADGTLGGLVQEAHHIELHLQHALRLGGLCSNDPICAHHAPGESMEKRWLHGAACHACTLVAETSCEMRNDYLDRALVVPVLGYPDAAYFRAVT